MPEFLNAPNAECELMAYILGLVVVDPLVGSILWKARIGDDCETRRWNQRHAGKTAGTVDGSYRRILVKVDGVARRVRCHRLMWFAVHGGPVPEALDHINGNGLDNRIANLRSATKRLNAENQRRARADSNLGLLGVRRHGNKFRAVIRTKGVKHHLGLFATANEAHAAYVSAKRALHLGGTL